MNTSASTPSPASETSADRWGFAAPQAVTLPQEAREDFFSNAPTETLVEFYDDVYRKGSYRNIWLNLNNLVADYHPGSSTYDEVTPEEMLRSSQHATVHVLRVGERS